MKEQKQKKSRGLESDEKSVANIRKTYLDNIKWMTVAIVVVYHVIYMFNGAGVAGGFGPFAPVQYQDSFLYLVYPWFMLLLFVVSGMSARFALERQPGKEFLKRRTVKLLVPSTIGMFVFCGSWGTSTWPSAGRSRLCQLCRGPYSTLLWR